MMMIKPNLAETYYSDIQSEESDSLIFLLYKTEFCLMIVDNKDNECEKDCIYLLILSQYFSNGDVNVKIL